MHEPWKKEKWWVSPYNFDKEALSTTSMPEHVEIRDVTLREGDETNGVVFSVNDKVKIAQALDELGINIEIGMDTSPNAVQTLKAVAKAGLTTKLCTMSQGIGNAKEKISLAAKLDYYGISIQFMSSDYHIERILKTTREKLLAEVTDLVTYAKDHDLWVNLFPSDCTRADLGFLGSLFKTVVEAHADCVTIVDTRGVCNPQAMAYLVRKIKEIVDVPVEIHAHNSYGLAIANSIAGYSAGAESISSTINGLGLGGNAPTEEIALSLLALYGVDLGLKYEKLFDVCNLVERLSKARIGDFKPIGGKRIFETEWGSKLTHWKLGEPTAAVSYLPDLVGQKLQVVLCKNADMEAIEEHLEKFGISATQKQKEVIIENVIEMAYKKKRQITEEEFKNIYARVLKYEP